MSTPLSNYPGTEEPTIGDANPTASSQVAGGGASLAKALDGHNHTAGKGLAVPFSALTADADLNFDRNPAEQMSYLRFFPIAAGAAPNNALFVDTSDGRLKFRDGTGTLRNIDTTP